MLVAGEARAEKPPRQIFQIIIERKNMKQNKTILAGLAIASLVMATKLLAITPNTVAITVPNAGVATWTNPWDYYAFRPVSVEAFQAGAATGTCTVTRIRAGRTNTVATVSIASNAGVSYITNTIYLFKGDQLVFTTSPSTNVVLEVTGEQLP